ncbi:cytochrome P450 [Xylariales sp. PMI_506]|nr:cytochrome P450 [Xylariales sp. PMI_506]
MTYKPFSKKVGSSSLQSLHSSVDSLFVHSTPSSNDHLVGSDETAISRAVSTLMDSDRQGSVTNLANAKRALKPRTVGYSERQPMSRQNPLDLNSSTVSVCVYRLFFHPLSRYPGPVLAKVSSLYSAYHAWKGDIHVDMARCHIRYGNYVRYAPDRLLFNTHKAFQDIYGHSSNVTKSIAYDALVHRAPNILTTRDKAQHGRRKRLISQGVSDASLRALEPAIIRHIQKFCRKVSEPDPAGSDWSTAKDISEWCNYLAFDIMSEITFSQQYDALENEDYRWVLDAIEESNVRISVLFQAPEVKLWRLNKHLFPQAIQARNKFLGFVRQLQRDRRELSKTANLKDIFSFIANATDPDGESAFKLDEVSAESTTLIVAGSDTTSTAMAALFFYLSRHPKALERATAEVRGAFQRVEEIRTGPRLNSCTYLRACIDETLRISPPSGSAPWREVGAGGSVFDGQYVPGGCDVGMGIYAMQHNPAYYPDPFTFKPDRWLAGEAQPGDGREPGSRANGKLNSGTNKVPYGPFSIGPRSCIGKGLAIMEVMLTMAHALYSLDLRKCDLEEESSLGGRSTGHALDIADEFQVRDHITSIKSGPMLQFRRRQ